MRCYRPRLLKASCSSKAFPAGSALVSATLYISTAWSVPHFTVATARIPGNDHVHVITTLAPSTVCDATASLFGVVTLCILYHLR